MAVTPSFWLAPCDRADADRADARYELDDCYVQELLSIDLAAGTLRFVGRSKYCCPYARKSLPRVATACMHPMWRSAVRIVEVVQGPMVCRTGRGSSHMAVDRLVKAAEQSPPFQPIPPLEPPSDAELAAEAHEALERALERAEAIRRGRANPWQQCDDACFSPCCVIDMRMSGPISFSPSPNLDQIISFPPPSLRT
jgi:hypothetical protein